MLVACGRFGFDPDDGAALDAPSGTVVATFGETPGATYSGVTSDTWIASEAPQNNYGASATMTTEGSQSLVLLRFDLTAISPGKIVVAARLHVDLSYVESSCSIAVAPILEQWIEGNGDGTSGVANWTQRTTTQLWSTAGAGSPGSADAAIASFQTSTNGPLGVDLPVATIQRWIDAPTTNFGFELSGSGGAECRFESSGSTPANRPELVITYYP